MVIETLDWIHACGYAFKCLIVLYLNVEAVKVCLNVTEIEPMRARL